MTPGEDPIGFDLFFEIFPSKVDRKQAVIAYASALSRGANVEDIIRGAHHYAEERKGGDPRYTKHAKNWLENDCWTNAPTDSQAVDLKLEIALLGKKIMKNGECARHLRNLELTFPNNLADRLGLLRVAAEAPNPVIFLNNWMWKHGPDGVNAGDLS